MRWVRGVATYKKGIKETSDWENRILTLFEV